MSRKMARKVFSSVWLALDWWLACAGKIVCREAKFTEGECLVILIHRNLISNKRSEGRAIPRAAVGRE